jgi:hypothetical protein
LTGTAVAHALPSPHENLAAEPADRGRLLATAHVLAIHLTSESPRAARAQERSSFGRVL